MPFFAGRLAHLGQESPPFNQLTNEGFIHRRARLANRFPVRWEKKIESGIAPPQLSG
jgi:hypothetical protein